MATKVKPSRLQVSWAPQVWQVPVYVNEDTFQWWAWWWWGASFWRFLSLWDSTTWMPISFPEAIPYTYITWDYFIVEVVSSATPPVNYKPDWSTYNGTASSVTESDEVEVWDTYVYDGQVWLLQSNHWKTVTFSNIAWDALDNASLSWYLNMKAFYLSSTSDLLTAQAAYSWQNWGRTALIVYNNKPYTYLWGNAAAMNFKCLYPYEKSSNQTWKTELVQDALVFSLSSWTVTSISANSRYNTISAYLNTDQNYTIPYTPQYDWSPATKKYVDDWLATKQDELVSSVNIRTINWTSILWSWDITTSSDVTVSSQSWNILTSWMKIWAWTQANYESLGTYDSNTVYLTI